MKRLIYSMPDGMVWRVRPTGSAITELMRFGKLTGTLHIVGEPVAQPTDVMSSAAAVDAVMAHLVTLVPVGATNIRIVAHTEYPSLEPGSAGLRFRNAWRQSLTGVVTIDIPLARLQCMNEVRSARVSKLEKANMDIEYAEDQATPALLARLRTYRQALRDVPQTNQASLDACTTPEAVGAWTPTWPVSPV